MDIIWIIYTIPLLILLGLVVYSAIKVFKNKTPLYFRITFFAAVCAMLEFVFNDIVLLCKTGEFVATNLGGLGIGGCCAFFLAANYGQFDSIIDGGSEKYRKERLISFAAPVVAFAALLYSIIIAEEKEVLFLIIVLINSLSILPCSYFNLKMIIIKDDGTGFIDGVKPLNILSLTYIVLQLVTTILTIYGLDIAVVDLALYFAFVIIVGAIIIFSMNWRKRWLSL